MSYRPTSLRSSLGHTRALALIAAFLAATCGLRAGSTNILAAADSTIRGLGFGHFERGFAPAFAVSGARLSS